MKAERGNLDLTQELGDVLSQDPAVKQVLGGRDPLEIMLVGLHSLAMYGKALEEQSRSPSSDPENDPDSD